jgi:hypothetical protein
MAEIKSESVADFMSESVADFARNTQPGKGLDVPDIVVLRILAKAPDRHVRDHAAAKIADRLVAHRRLLS